MTNISGHNELSPNSELRSVALQIQKDFMMFSEELEVDEVSSFEALQNTVHRLVSELLHRNKSKLTQIIYRIDIPEKAISQALNPENEEGFEQAISRLMVERTRLKIQLRKSFG